MARSQAEMAEKNGAEDIGAVQRDDLWKEQGGAEMGIGAIEDRTGEDAPAYTKTLINQMLRSDSMNPMNTWGAWGNAGDRKCNHFSDIFHMVNPDSPEEFVDELFDLKFPNGETGDMRLQEAASDEAQRIREIVDWFIQVEQTVGLDAAMMVIAEAKLHEYAHNFDAERDAVRRYCESNDVDPSEALFQSAKITGRIGIQNPEGSGIDAYVPRMKETIQVKPADWRRDFDVSEVDTVLLYDDSEPAEGRRVMAIDVSEIDHTSEL